MDGLEPAVKSAALTMIFLGLGLFALVPALDFLFTIVIVICMGSMVLTIGIWFSVMLARNIRMLSFITSFFSNKHAAWISAACCIILCIGLSQSTWLTIFFYGELPPSPILLKFDYILGYPLLAGCYCFGMSWYYRILGTDKPLSQNTKGQEVD